MKQRLLGAELPSISGHAFTRLIERMLWHLGFEDVSNVDGSGDGGADLVATRAGRRWVFQAKSKRTTAVSGSAVDEVRDGMIAFNADRGVVVTNSRFAPSARTRCQELRLSSALQIDLWDRELLIRMASDPAFQVRFRQPDLRRYQVDAFQACMGDLKREGRAFAVLATGLGKTVIAGSVIDAVIDANPGARVLILANKTELVDQLEHAIWRHLPDDVPTQQINSLNHPEDLPGVTVATIQSAISYARRGFRPDFIFVDEAHNVSSDGLFRELISLCPDVPLLGATATPWRGDRFDVSAVFGEPSVAIGIEEGMRLGYLADVDYRLYTDNIDWSYIRSKSANNYTIGNLNRSLFLPQRDEIHSPTTRNRLLSIHRPRRALVGHTPRRSRLGACGRNTYRIAEP